MLIILYNTLIITLLLLWFKRKKLKNTFKKLSKNNAVNLFLTISLITLATITNLYIEDHTDVDNVIRSSSKALTSLQNPYTEKVVQFILTDGTEVYDIYSYFPVTLIYYSFFYLFFGFTYFIVIANLFLIPLIIHYTNRLVELNKNNYYLLAIIISIFLFNNSLLMLCLFVIGEFYRKKEKKSTSLIFYSLSAMVKYITGLYIILLFINDVKKKKNPLPYVIPLLVFILISIPFGVINVFKGAILHQAVPSYRTAVAQTEGPILIEVLKALSLTNLIVIIAPFLLFSFYWLIRKQKFFIKSISTHLFLTLLLPFYGTELLIIPLYQILLWSSKNNYQ